jgi:hypothetical protein
VLSSDLCKRWLSTGAVRIVQVQQQGRQLYRVTARNSGNKATLGHAGQPAAIHSPHTHLAMYCSSSFTCSTPSTFTSSEAESKQNKP